MPYCPNCGQPTVPGAISCAACGAALPLPPAAPPGPPPVTYVTPAPQPHPFTPAMPPPTMATPPRARPVGVAILAVLQWVGAGFMVLYGIILVALGPAILSYAPQNASTEGVDPAELSGFVVGFGVALFAFAGLAVWIGVGLWRGRSWARVTHLVLACVSGVFTALFLVASIAIAPAAALFYAPFLAYDAFLVWYWTRPGVKAWFAPPAPEIVAPTW